MTLLLSFVLNLPYTLIGIFLALASIPSRVYIKMYPGAIIFHVRRFWWEFRYLRHARAMTIGHVILLSPLTEPRDLEHEIIHVEQYARAPLIHPLLYYLELYKKGYKENKFEVEAYARGGNVYRSGT